MNIQQLYDKLSDKEKEIFLKNNELVNFNNIKFNYDFDEEYRSYFCYKCLTIKVEHEQHITTCHNNCENYYACEICDQKEYIDGVDKYKDIDYFCNNCQKCYNCKKLIKEKIYVHECDVSGREFNSYCDNCIYKNSYGSIPKNELRSEFKYKFRWEPRGNKIANLKDIVLLYVFEKLEYKNIEKKYPLLFKSDLFDEITRYF